jgi:hypothetical protein
MRGKNLENVKQKTEDNRVKDFVSHSVRLAPPPPPKKNPSFSSPPSHGKVVKLRKLLEDNIMAQIRKKFRLSTGFCKETGGGGWKGHVVRQLQPYS